ncbi:hypothetical protein [Streptomyces sp. NPDC005017]|uniref:nSTAND3 domain-containing NTPase n=1 Tax=Streptomyces sp. NPDC005017 TaxID=3364706 RepID=UPI003694944F
MPIVNEGFEVSRPRPIGGGEITGTMLHYWRILHLAEDEEPSAGMDELMADEELLERIRALDTVAVPPLPRDIEELSDSSRFLHARSRSASECEGPEDGQEVLRALPAHAGHMAAFPYEFPGDDPITPYLYSPFDTSRATLGIVKAESVRRTLGRLDSHAVNTLLEQYVQPDSFEDAAQALRQDHVVVLTGPAGMGKRSAAVALLNTVMERTECVELSPDSSLEELADGRLAFQHGVGYLLSDHRQEDSASTAEYAWRRVSDTVRDRGAYLVVTTANQTGRETLRSVRHLPWQLPDLTTVLRVRLLRAGCVEDTVERAVSCMPAGCRIAQIAAAADQIAYGADPEEVWLEHTAAQAQPVRDWFDNTRSAHEWIEITTLAFTTGLSHQDFVTCMKRLEESMAATLSAPATRDESAKAVQHDADGLPPSSLNTLLAPRTGGAPDHFPLVFHHPHYRQRVMEELWARGSTAYWHSVREWLTLLAGQTRPRLMQLSIASGLALLARPASHEVTENYLTSWAAGSAGPGGQSTAVLAVHCMSLDDQLAANALSLARDWAAAPEPELHTTAAAAFSGPLGVRFPTDAVTTLLRMLDRSQQAEKATAALAALAAALRENGHDAGAVLRPLAHQIKNPTGKHAARHTERRLDAALTVLQTRDAATGRLLCAVLAAQDPRNADTIGELWAELLKHQPRRHQGLQILEATLRDLPALTHQPQHTAQQLGRSLGSALPPRERLRLGLSLSPALTRPDDATDALIDTTLHAALTTRD